MYGSSPVRSAGTLAATLFAVVALLCGLAVVAAPASVAATASEYGYPYPNAPDCDESSGAGCVLDNWSFWQGQCTSWVAFRVSQLNGVRFDDFYRMPNGEPWGDASHWGAAAQLAGIVVNDTPALGSIAWFSEGHVGYVEAVRTDGTVSMSEMNFDLHNGFRVTTLTRGVYWPTGFIHVADRSNAPANELSQGAWVLTNSLAPDVDVNNRVRSGFGGTGYEPVVGDWNGDGIDTAGVFEPATGTWVLTNSLHPETDTGDRIVFHFGSSAYVPVAGDWNGDGFDSPGLFQPATGRWVFTNSLHPDADTADRIRFQFGWSVFAPVVGDWNGDGIDTAGAFDPSSGTWVLTNSLHPDADTADRIRFQFGSSANVPVSGDWNGDGIDSPGLFQPATGGWVLTNSLHPDADTGDRVRFRFGSSGYLAVAGNWDGTAGDTPGVAR